MADDDFALPFTTEPLPGSDPGIDWGDVIRAARNTLEARKAALETQCRPIHVTVPGHEVSLPSKASTAGKVAELVLAAGGEVKAGESEYFSGDTVVPVNVKKEGRRTPQTIDYRIKPGQNKVHRWLDFALNGRRGCVTGSTIVYDGKEYTLDEFREEMG